MSRKCLVLCTHATGMYLITIQAALAGSIHVHQTLELMQGGSAPNMSLYDTLMERFESDQKAFDLHHPLLGHMLSDPQFADKWLERWEKDEIGFEHRHHVIWEALEKYLFIEEAMRLSTDPPPISSPPAPGFDPKPPPSPSPFNDPPSVPEPASLIMALTSLIFVVVARQGCIKVAQ